MIDREHCRSASAQVNEANDCTVQACAVATQIDYPAMRDYLAGYGRKPRRGMMPMLYLKALRDLGCKLTKLDGPKYRIDATFIEGHYYVTRDGLETYRNGFWRSTRKKIADGTDYNAATVRSLQRELTTGTYLVQTDGHLLCLRDGIAEDFTNGRLHRVELVYRVEL